MRLGLQTMCRLGRWYTLIAGRATQLSKAGFKHFTVNHSLNFDDPETAVHTQNIERMWGMLKVEEQAAQGHKKGFIGWLLHRVYVPPRNGC